MPSAKTRLGVVPRILTLSVSGVLLLGLAVSTLSAVLLRGAAVDAARERVDADMRVAWDQLRAKGTPLRLADGRLLAGGHVLNNDFEVVDKVKVLVGGTATLFMGDTRISTNVLKPDGSRAVGTQLARGPAFEAVFGARTGYRGEAAILGEPYMTAYDPILDTEGKVIGALFVGIPKADFLVAADRTLTLVIIATVLVGTLSIAAALVVARRSLTLPLKSAVAAMSRLAEGDLNAAVPAADRGDEIGEINAALAVFKESGLARRRLEEAQAAERLARDRRQKEMERLTSEFNTEMVAVLGQVTDAARHLKESAAEMAGVADDTSRRSAMVAAAAEQASANVQTVAAAAEEMAAAESEISRQVECSTAVSRRAAEEAERVNATVATLSRTTDRIGEVVTLINNIAAQTNLLALNATIEAARAGEAGKGFAVVAGEVKNLAGQTARATEEITTQIAEVQSVTRDAVNAIEAIGRTIAAISESAAAIAAAVEEQTAATGEIARNVQEASRGTGEVTSAIVHVKDGAATTGSAAQRLLNTADDLSRQSELLAGDVRAFLAGIDATAGRPA